MGSITCILGVRKYIHETLVPLSLYNIDTGIYIYIYRLGGGGGGGRFEDHAATSRQQCLLPAI